MSDAELLMALATALGTGVAAEILRRIVPGTKHDSGAVWILGLVSNLLTVGVMSFLPGDGRKKRK